MDSWWRELGELNDEQRSVIGLPAEGSFLVNGPPGSGKTNLLLLRANYMAVTEHANLAVVVFNRTLREFIRAGSEQYNFDPDNVWTSRMFFDRLLTEAHADYERTNNFDIDRQRRIAALQRAIPPGRDPIFEVIMLDEAQDYLASELHLFRRLAHNLFMVAGLRQQIYPGEAVADVLRKMVNDVLPLRFHYRSGQPICEVADMIGATFSAGYEPILPTCNYNSPGMRPSVEVFVGNIEAQAAEITNRLAVQRRTYPEGLLGVICPRLGELRIIAGALQASRLGDQLCVQDREDGYQIIRADRPIWMSTTVHSAKGLEFRALHFAGAEHVKSFRAEQKRLAYTGVTRAKTSLVVYYHNNLPGYFDAALNSIHPPPRDTADLGVAFGRR
jgi:superfamily I DNA/RNA helicase